MSKLFVDISMSLDGYVAGPEPSLDDPLGKGGEQLHEWAFDLKEWREPHGREGGETNASSHVMAETLEREGAAIIGRRMFSGGQGPWEDDPNANGWWGEEPPFHHPIFVLTHHEREPLTLGETTFTFVTDGIESALDQARDAAATKTWASGAAARRCSSTFAPVWWTSYRCTWPRCSSAAARGCSTTWANSRRN